MTSAGEKARRPSSYKGEALFAGLRKPWGSFNLVAVAGVSQGRAIAG